MIFALSLFIIFLCLFMSLRMLFLPQKIKGKQMSLENFIILLFIYATVMLGFGLIYHILELHGHQVFIEEISRSTNLLERLETSIYFSAVTLFSVGYGDISPIGFGRAIAVVEALIGYTIPAAFVARTVIDMDKK